MLDILVQSRRDQHAAERFLHRVLDAEDGAEPRVIITDKLAGYVPAGSVAGGSSASQLDAN